MILPGPIRRIRRFLQLSPLARAEHRHDRRGLVSEDPGIATAIDATLDWLKKAQDRSSTHDGGVARHFSLNEGWGPSYPETTGYIIPTVLHLAERRNDDRLRERARRMLDFLVAIQLPEGAFQGGVIGASPVRATTFNTGQILIGLAAGAQRFTAPYIEPMHRAARWLVENQDRDGAWRKGRSPFAVGGVQSYETHVAWSLFEAARISAEEQYGDAGLANVRWALGKQHTNGWFSDCCLSDASRPLTHTLGYALRGVLEAYRFSQDETFLSAAQRTADGIRSALREDGFLPGRLDANWKAAVDWCCLTGAVQIARCWIMLYRFTRREEYLRAAKAANGYVRRTIRTDGPEGIRGGVKGSFPIWGEYLSYEYPNWAAKFFLDSCLAEQDAEHLSA
jgi:Squalene-hopene cyclase C-terminal domain